MRFTELNDDNYLLFAIKFYENPHAVTREDFEDDLKKIKYVKRLLRRYQNSNVLKTHLILNHLTVLFNVFGDAAVPLLFYNLEIECYRALKEEGAMGASAGVPANNASSGAIAGLPPDEPPVDLRKRGPRQLNMFYRQAVKQSRKGAKNGRKSNR